MAEVDSLEIRISASSQQAAQSIDKLVTSMTNLKNAMKGGIGGAQFKNLANNLRELGDAAKNVEDSIGALAKAAKAIERLSSIGKVRIPKGIADGLKNVGSAAEAITPQAVENLDNMTRSLQRLSNLDLKGVGSALRGVRASTREAAQPKTSGTTTVETPSKGLGSFRSLFSKGLPKITPNIDTSALKKVSDLAKTALGHLKALGQKIRLKIEAATLDKVKEKLKGVQTILRSFGRIAFYRMIRSAIKAITQAFQEGLANAKAFSEGLSNAIDGRIAVAINNLNASTMTMKNQLGAAFGSLLTAIAPIISTLIGLITSLATALTQLFAAFTGGTFLKARDVSGDLADNMKAGGGAAKEWKNQLMGFDEINRLEDQSGGGGGGGGGGLDPSDMFDVVPIDKAIMDFVGKIKEAFNNGDWQGLGTLLGDKVNEIFDSIDWAGIGKKIGYYINGLIQTLYYFLKTIDFVKIGKDIATLINNALEQIDFTVLGRLLVRKFTAAVDFWIGFITELNWGDVATAISDFIKGALDEASEWLSSYNWEEIAATIGDNIKDFLDKLDAAGIADSLSTLITNALTALKDLLVGLDWAGIAIKIKDKLVEFIGGMDTEGISESLKGVMSAAFDAAFAIVDALFPDGIITSLVNAIINLVTNAVTTLKDEDFQEAHNIFSYKLDKALFGAKFADWWWSKGDYAGKDVVMGLINGIETGGDVAASVDTNIVKPVTDTFVNFVPTIDEYGNEIFVAMDGSFAKTSASAAGFATDVGGSAAEVGTAVDGISSASWSASSDASNAFASLGQSIYGWCASIVRWIADVIASFNQLGEVTGGGYSQFSGWAADVHGYTQKAAGGFVDSGQLFVAREAGPELVGTMGGHTAVANNDQIVEGISQGVYGAVLAAMSNGGGGSNQPIAIYLDGREIARTTTKYQQQMARAGAY